MLELAEARVSDANLDLVKRQVDVAGVSLVGGKFAATRDVKGMVDWQTLFLVEEGAAAGRPATMRCVRVASAPHTVQIAVSFVTWSASASSVGMALNDWILVAALASRMRWRKPWSMVRT